MARLVIQASGQEPRLYELVKARVTLGRAEQNDLVLNDLNASRFHAALEFTPQGYRISDLNSLNGILVDGQRCREALLQNGSKVRVGDTVIRFEDSRTWENSTLVERNQTAAILLAESEQRGLREATVAFRHLSVRALPANLPEMQKQLQEAERRALLFELVSRARRSLQEAGTAEQVLDTIPRLVFSATRAERVLVMLWDEQKQCLCPGEIHAAPGLQLQDTEVALSQTLLNAVLQSRSAVLVLDARTDPALAERQSVVLSGLRSAVCVPMAVQDRLYGLVYADNCRRPVAFGEDDLEVLSVFAREGALALDSTRAREQLLEQERIRLAYRRFLPEHLAEWLVSQPEAVQLGGVRQQVTALFADLRGFTSLAEDLPPEEAVELLNAFFTEMTEVIFQHGGTVDKFLGDGLLAVFGAPLPEPTHALRAVQCAIGMQAALDRVTQEWRTQGRPVIPMGIGVNSGEAIAGNIGSPQRMEYTVIGDTVNVAARLTAHAGPGEILLGESTWQQVQAVVAAEALPPLALKGKRAPPRVYRVSARAQAASSPGG